jgi:regulator of replication initiation timing
MASEKRPRDNTRKETKDGGLSKLKQRMRKLELENERLKKEIRTLEGYKKATNTFIDNELDGIPVERVIKGIERQSNLKEIVKEEKHYCKKCFNEEVTVVGRPDGKKVVMCFKCKTNEVI